VAEDLLEGKGNAGFDDMVFSDGDEYLFSEIRKHGLGMVLGFMILVTGLIIVVVGLILKLNAEQKVETIALGMVTMVLSLWTVTRLVVFGVLIQNPALVRFFNYFMLIVLPIPWILFIACLMKDMKSRIVPILISASMINMVVQFYMVATGKKDYVEMVWGSHLLFSVGVGMTVVMAIKGFVSKKMQLRQQWLLVVAFILQMSSGVLDLIQYYAGGTYADRFSRFALVIFISLILTHEIHEFFVLSQKDYQMEVMRRLAHQDGLTGLENRLSFNIYEEELMKMRSGKCLIIQFDINNLKKVNDNYGHAAGDDFIRAGADAIMRTFGKHGRVFRTGGDEFISVILRADNSQDLMEQFERCAKAMDAILLRYNEEAKSPIPLHIAYGMAECDLASNDLSAKEILADTRMYEYKREIKKME